MNDRAEQALTYHIECHKLFSAVAAVFEHHAVYAGFLIRAYKTEAILDIICAADLWADLFTCTHSGDTHFNVGFPRGENKNSLYLGVFDNLAPVSCFEGANAGFILDSLCACFCAVLVIITNSGDFQKSVFPHRKEHGINKRKSACAETDDTDLYFSDIAHRDILRFFIIGL